MGKRHTKAKSDRQAPQIGDLVTGIFQAGGRRGGYVVPDTAGLEDLRIPPMSAGAALHGDTVQARLTRLKEGRQPRAQIVKIIKHANKRLIGRLSYGGGKAFVHPKNAKIKRYVELRGRLDPAEAPDGVWVVVEIRQWSSSPDEPLLGRLLEVLGSDDEPGLPILLLVRSGGIEIEFPAEVEREAQRLLEAAPPDEPGGPSRARRRDFRGRRVITIDPATAKDFDDAVELIEVLPDGWRVGVHIADVAHYVRPGTALDAEAYERATSIYPVDRVIPMLPEALSNQLCSLRPGEDKLTMSALFKVDRHGQVSEVELCNSLIHSVRRFAYEEVQGLFDVEDLATGAREEPRRPPLPAPAVPDALLDDLMELRLAGRALREARMRRGALDLDLPEPEILFDADRRVVDLRYAERHEAHQLIEELMIAANEAVARELEKRSLPLLFRVHDEPSEDKLLVIGPVLARLGIPVPAHGGMSRAELQHALEKARAHPAGIVVQRWVLRAMMRAKYQPENLGHFGLASESYCHFTSPIRRYPDLIVHRVVKAMLRGARAADEEMQALREELPARGRHTSAREERAQRAEWDAQEILALQYMKRYLGDIFEGFIAGVGPMGFFVALKDYPVEGLVRISQLDDDFYDLDDVRHIWQGRRSGRTWALGDPVSVMIERIDVLAGQMDLILVRQGRKPARGGATGSAGPRTGGGGRRGGRWGRRRD
ncbi:MAG TPA: ribonuclease R [Candidatus Sumerlaeota bacterium]|nr:ribonuclease R [Candidatus Sumerlaeota bacterium]HPK03412.1 ribonuclease R [Candidatus Sumerlaeota bacterium]